MKSNLPFLVMVIGILSLILLTLSTNTLMLSGQTVNPLINMQKNQVFGIFLLILGVITTMIYLLRVK